MKPFCKKFMKLCRNFTRSASKEPNLFLCSFSVRRTSVAPVFFEQAPALRCFGPGISPSLCLSSCLLRLWSWVNKQTNFEIKWIRLQIYQWGHHFRWILVVRQHTPIQNLYKIPAQGTVWWNLVHIRTKDKSGWIDCWLDSRLPRPWR